ncbi:hypothetical protein [Planococcus sp. S3-L1]|uniref:hypothetical protein n=1 Tax=Planococcus sp. S3-L1 TaxID=3046200 RepID=UPI0024B98BF6|nr:hypothetical protein [Planococcus sp. S3-L1]MDJ0331723.1 hypothetical protein [Planococcus sp. S3-L1]
MTLIDKITLTEHEAILLTIEYGFEGNELNTKKWIKNGSLDGAIDKASMEYKDRAIVALINKLKTFYDYVQVEGKGKSRRYILSGKKDEQTERVFNYTSFASSPEGKLVIEYIFNQLVEIREDENSISNWSRVVGLPMVDNTSAKSAAKEMASLYSSHLGDNTAKLINKAIDEINFTIGGRNIEIVKRVFKQLKKQKRIEAISTYYFKKLDGSVQVVNQAEYQKLKDAIKEIVEEQEVEFKSYMNARRFKNFHSKELKECNLLVKKYLTEQGIDYEFERLIVKVISDEIKMIVTKKELYRTWCDNFLDLTYKKQKSEKYQNSPYMSKEFYLLNVCLLLKSYLSERQLLIVESEKSNMDRRFSTMYENYIEVKMLEAEVNNKPIGFGQTIEHTA